MSEVQGVNPQRNVSYIYDTMGNRQSVQGSFSSGGTSTSISICYKKLMSNKLPFSPLGYTPNLSVENAERARDFWMNRPELSRETRHKLHDADILIVPEGDDYMGKGAFFPEGTVDFYHFLMTQNVSVEVAAEDDDFRELARHFNLHILGEYVVKDVALPIFIGLLLKYLENRLFNPEKSAIRIGVTCEKADGSAKHLTYEGPVEDFDVKVKSLLHELLQESPPSPVSLPGVSEEEQAKSEG